MHFREIRKDLQTALDAKVRRLEMLLQAAGEILGAQGVALWGIFPEPKNHHELTANPDRFHLFTISSWFEEAKPGEFYGYDRVRLTTSNVGSAALRNKAVNGWEPGKTATNKEYCLDFPLLKHGMFERHGIQYMAAAPMVKNGKPWGAISAYRSEGPDPMWFVGKHDEFAAAKNEREVMEDLAFMMPVMFEAIRNDNRLHFLEEVDLILRRAEQQRFEKPAVSKNDVKKVIMELCDCIAKVFHCDEVTVIMEELDAKTPAYKKSTHPYELQHTTYKGKNEKGIGPYAGKVDEGLTGWVLANARTMWIPDLTEFQHDKEEHQKVFHGADWKNSSGRVFQNKQGAPISFMAAPITMGGEVKGVIRCTSREREPVHYTEDDADALNLGGSRIALAYHGWQLALRDKLETDIARRESTRWEKFLDKLGKVQEQALNAMRQPAPSRDRICENLLSVVPQYVGNVGICSIRLLENQVLVPAFPPDVKLLPEQKKALFAIEGEAKSLSVLVFKDRKTTFFSDAKKHDLYAGVIDAKHTKDMVIAPIVISPDEEPLGVLAIHSTRPMTNPAFCMRVADVLGRQLALYLELYETVKKLADARKNAEHDRGVLQRVFRDVRHQLRGPLNAVPGQIAQLLDEIRKLKVTDTNIERRFHVLCGLCNKASSVVHNIRILSDIEEGKPLKPHLVPLSQDKVERLLRQMAEDHENMADPDHPVHFAVDSDALKEVKWNQYCVDFELIEQALFCLCDNALKYSYASKRVIISAHSTAASQLCISITNEGPHVTPHEAGHVMERGWRGTAAQLFRADGTGIGCFLTHCIMQAHEGTFQLEPTNAKGETMACLYFPCNDTIK